MSDTENQNQQQPVHLTPEHATEIIGAYHRLKELGAGKIINPRNEAEQTGLVQYLNRELFEHAEELFGNWVVLHNEYEPLIKGFTALLARASAQIAAREAARQQAEKKSA